MKNTTDALSTVLGENMEDRTFIDLFAGAGGLSEGFINQGFCPVAHVEKDGYASSTLKTRMVYHHLRKNIQLKKYRRYLKGELEREELYAAAPSELLTSVVNGELTGKTCDQIIQRVNDILDSSKHDTVDVIVGGPPCQAYSLVGRARDRTGKENDPRNRLYRLYIKFLNFFKPQIFVFENVPGLISAGNGKFFRDVKRKFRKEGYEIDHRLLNAHNFGVLQRRKRVIIIGWKRELDFGYPEFDGEPPEYLVRDVLDDLPSLQPGENIEHGEYEGPPSEYLLNYGLRKKRDILTLHIARPHNKRDRKIYEMAIRMWNEDRKRLKYTDVPDKYRTHSNTTSFLDRYKVVASDLPCSHTIVAHIAKDGHYYIHPDISQLRSLSVREAARFQSFPDSYYFEGPRTSVFRQIGNAVPPLMAKEIAKKIHEGMNSL